MNYMKSQSAMEYLMTYGWAILIIVVVLVALYALGVFNPFNFAATAQTGACNVYRPYGAGTTTQIALTGVCSGFIPKFVASFSGQGSSGILIPSVSPDPGNQVTITLWVSPPAGINSAFNDNMLVDGDGTAFKIGFGGCNFYNAASSEWVFAHGEPQRSTWTFWACSATVGGEQSIYLQGNNTAYTNQNPGGSSLFPGQFWSIGNEGFGSAPYLGFMSNVQVYDTVLSTNSIQALYQEGMGGAPIDLQDLIAWWPLNGNAYDYSGNNNTGTSGNVVYLGSWWHSAPYTPP